MSKVDKILDRVKKLLKLSESPNLNEAEAAAAKAQELLTKYKLSMFEVENFNDQEQEEILNLTDDDSLDSFKNNIALWKTTLAVAIAKANNCRIYTLRIKTEEDIDKAKLALVGTVSNTQIVKCLYHYIVNEIERLAKRDGTGKGRFWINSFKLGATSQIEKRLKEINNSLLKTASPHAIVLYKKESSNVDKWIEDHLKLKRGGTRNPEYNVSGLLAGQRAANEINLENNQRLGEGHEYLNS